MQANQIKVDGFYSLRDGTVVRVVKKHASVSLSHAVYDVFEAESQEPYQVSARDLVKRVPDPNKATPADGIDAIEDKAHAKSIISFKSQAALDKFVNAAIAKGSKK